MKVLIVGSGGREHAIAWSVAKSPKVDKIYCAPGNAGIAEFAECVNIKAMEFDKLVAFAKENAIDLTIIGMDDPLVGGVVDAFESEGLRVFGPRKNAAIIEGSKAFSKDLMKKYKIPTAAYENFTDPDEAIKYLETAKMPIVLKADGLALGKGVLICNTLEEAKEGVKTLMLDKQFGDAGNEIVIEEFMTGREVSVLAFCDGKTIKCMTSAQDHKRAKDGDQGLNTGGMGTFSPSPFYNDEVEAFCEKYVYQSTIDAMASEGRPFTGILFTGLMITEDGPKVLEYNARFGDPEAQVVLPRMKNDIIDVMEACIDGKLSDVELEFEDNAAVCVVLASDGYPEKYDKGFEIKGLDTFKDKDGYYVFHAGTKFDGDKIVTNGGRVLGVVAKGENLKAARANAYKATEWIDFANMGFGTAIGIVFFLLVLFAAVTSSIALTESAVSTFEDELHWSRKKSTVFMGMVMLLLGTLSCLGYGPLANFKILGMQFLDFFDFITNSVMMPIAAIATCLLVSKVVGVDKIEEEITKDGQAFRRKKIFCFMIKYLCPLFAAIILISSVANAFGIITM